MTSIGEETTWIITFDYFDDSSIFIIEAVAACAEFCWDKLEQLTS